MLVFSMSAPATAPASIAAEADTRRRGPLTCASGKAGIGGQARERQGQDRCGEVRDGDPPHGGVADAHPECQQSHDRVSGELVGMDVTHGCDHRGDRDDRRLEQQGGAEST